MTCQQILLTCLIEKPKMEESETTETKSKLIFLERLKPKLAYIIGTKRGINLNCFIRLNKAKYLKHIVVFINIDRTNLNS